MRPTCCTKVSGTPRPSAAPSNGAHLAAQVRAKGAAYAGIALAHSFHEFLLSGCSSTGSVLPMHRCGHVLAVIKSKDYTAAPLAPALMDGRFPLESTCPMLRACGSSPYFMLVFLQPRIRPFRWST